MSAPSLYVLLGFLVAQESADADCRCGECLADRQRDRRVVMDCYTDAEIEVAKVEYRSWLEAQS